MRLWFLLIIFASMSLKVNSQETSNFSLTAKFQSEYFGIVTAMDETGSFTINEDETQLRFFGLRIKDTFPRSEIIGQPVACRSVIEVEERTFRGIQQEPIAVQCKFTSLFLRSDVGDALVDTGYAVRVCDPHFDYVLACRHEK